MARTRDSTSTATRRYEAARKRLPRLDPKRSRSSDLMQKPDDDNDHHHHNQVQISHSLSDSRIDDDAVGKPGLDPSDYSDEFLPSDASQNSDLNPIRHNTYALVDAGPVYRSESVSPRRSITTTIAIAKTNRDGDNRSSDDAEPGTKSDDDEPVACLSPPRNDSKHNALRHIKKKVDFGKRRQHQPHPYDKGAGVNRAGSVERERVEQIQVEQEERLKELERDKFLLESQLNQLSVSVSGSLRERLAAGAPFPVAVDQSQLAAIQKEMHTMDKIIEALNEENAKLYASLRGEQTNMKGTAQQMLARNKSLRAELDLAQAEIHELKASKLTTADESAQEEIRRLKHAVVQQRNDLEAKLRAAQSQVESLRRANEELDYRLSTVNYEPASPRRQRPGTPVKSKAATDKHEKEIAELREKLQWYIENQKMIDDLQARIATKDDAIRTLQHRVDLLYAETKSGRKKTATALTAPDMKRLRDLENENAQLKKLQPHKRAVTALVKAANRPDKRTVGQLEKAVEQLQAELGGKDADYIARMRSLRQECDKMRVQYEERLAQLLADQREHARPNERIRELEDQIEEMRETYRRKGQAVAAKRDVANSATQTAACRDDKGEDRRTSESKQLWDRVEMAERQNQCDRERIDELVAQLSAVKPHPDSDFDAVIAGVNEAHSAQIASLHREIQHLSESLRRNPEMILDRTATSHLVASLQSQLDVANREKNALKESLIDTQYELSRLRSMPTHVQINALELKLNEIEARHAVRETNLREVVRHLEQQVDLRSGQSAAKYETMIREKNAQIHQFKSELDALLSDLSRLQQKVERQ